MITNSTPHLDVLTFVMTLEYNGYEYAGFQRQTATNQQEQYTYSPTNNTKSSKRPRRNNASSTTATSHPVVTVQHQLEMALQQWTNLCIATLRVRGAGRTDKGVHATGQVVAFDIPVRLLKLEQDTNHLNNGNNKEDEALSEQCIVHLQEAYHVLTRHLQQQSSVNNATAKRSTKSTIDQWQIRRAVTTRLRCSDIAIRSVRMYTGGSIMHKQPFEARRHIKCKTYVYKLRFRRLAYLPCVVHDMKDIIHPICHAGPHILRRIDDNNTIWLCPWPLDSTLLSLACDGFVGKHDFVNFVHKDERKADEFRDGGGGGRQHEIDLFEFNIVESVTDEKDEEEELGDDLMLLPPVVDATFTLSAKGFHRSMVRNLVGFVVDIARGLRSIDDIPLLLSNKGGNYLHSCGKVNAAPACGLCLAKVEYEHDNLL